MESPAYKPFPIPVVPALGPGSQDDDAPDYLPLPQGMSTYQPPPLPEPEELAAHGGCVAVLAQALAALRQPAAIARHQVIALDGLPDADRRLLNQVLGEGEVAAQLLAEDGAGPRLQAQESVFAGVWRVLHLAPGAAPRDTLEIAAVPQALVAAAAIAGAPEADPSAPPPAELMNAPALLAELDEQRRAWRPGRPPHVLNLSLLPLSAGDSALLDRRLGAGAVQILSRGYGNCRIVNTRWPRTWRVTYFNSSDIIILDTLEVCAVPEVACAAAEDLEDSAERLAEVLDWVRAA